MSDNRLHDEIEPLPPEFEPLQRRLLADGAHWRAGLPSTRRLEQRLNALTRQQRAASPQADDTERVNRLRLVTPPKGEPSMFHGRLRTITALVAIAAVVALFAVLFYGFANGRNTRTAQSSQTIPPTPGANNGHPTPDPNHGYGMPQIAPGNPQVVYQLGPANQSLILQRSTDGGKTWHEFSLPGQFSLASSLIFVSPLNAQYVFLTVTGTRSGNDCVVKHLSSYSTLSGGQHVCGIQYLSTDGGAHWTMLHMPALPDGRQGVLGGTSILNLSTMPAASSTQVLRVQGERLYSALGPYTQDGQIPGTPGARLVTSTDGGVTWQLVDTDLVASGKNICDYAPDPGSSTLFAITTTTCNAEAPDGMFLWRSDDAGAHWAQVGQLPANTNMGMIVVSRGNGAQPLLYINMAQAPISSGTYAADLFRPQTGGSSLDLSPANVQVSADGGKTWTAAPTKGFPDAHQNPGAPLGVLSDGSVLFTYNSNFYAWKAGDSSWHEVGHRVSGQVYYAFVTAPDASGKQTLCVVAGTPFKIVYEQL